MYKDQISDNKLITMAEEAAMRMDPELYEKGKDYHYQGRVKFSRVFGSIIYSTVNDSKMYTVQILMEDFPQSTCTCAKKHLCEHIAAAFFYYYEPWLRSNGISYKMNFTPGSNPPSEKTPVKGKNSVHNSPVPEGPVELWYKYFEREYNLLRDSQKGYIQTYNDYFAGELYFSNRLLEDFNTGISVHSKDWPPFNKALYQFHSNLFFMARLEKQIKDVKLSYMYSFQMKAVENRYIQAFISTLSFKQQEEYQPFFQKSVEVVHERLFQGKTPLFDWLLIYRLMCVNIFDSHEWREKETACLEELMQHDKNRQGNYYAALGLASLKMSARQFDAALDVLQKLKEKSIDDLLFYLKYLAGLKEWEKLLVWLRWLAPDIKEANPAVFEDICECCVLAAKNSSAGKEFIQLVRSWLPRSFDSYARYLLEAGLFGEWSELNMSYQICTWESVDKKALRYLESRDSAALLPLYHQWAARLIEDKNRRSYQEAVQLLKKLRALYNRQKMAGEWNTFISRLASHYQRLRAFQEELRKGKLI